MSGLGPDSDAAGWELASAYIDDDVDAVGRAQVESSAEILAMVVELRQLRDGLVTPPAAPRVARESAIAAALAAFDAGHVTSNPVASTYAAPDVVGPPAHPAVTSGAPTTPPAVVHDLDARRGRRRFTWIMGAAAAVIVVVVGVVALRSGNGSDTNLSARRQPTATTNLPEAADAGGAGDSQAAATSPAAAPNQAAATTTAGRTQPAAATTAATAAPDGAGSGAGAPPVAATSVVVELTSPDELLALPRPAVATSPAPDSGGTRGSSASASTVATAVTTAAPSPRCVQSPAVLLAVIDYRGVAAIAVVDDVRHVRTAIRASDCVVLAEVPDGQ